MRVNIKYFSNKFVLLQHTDMSEEMRTEAVELSVTACEKFSQNNELAARMVKESMDKKFGPAFHVVVGESYGFEITYECTTICYMYFGGNQAICIWKCSWIFYVSFRIRESLENCGLRIRPDDTTCAEFNLLFINTLWIIIMHSNINVNGIKLFLVINVYIYLYKKLSSKLPLYLQQRACKIGKLW